VRIQHFGFLANRRRTKLLPLCVQLLGSTPETLAKGTLPPPMTFLISVAVPNTQDR
jgi:hypothetical protein